MLLPLVRFPVKLYWSVKYVEHLESKNSFIEFGKLINACDWFVCLLLIKNKVCRFLFWIVEIGADCFGWSRYVLFSTYAFP